MNRKRLVSTVLLSTLVCAGLAITSLHALFSRAYAQTPEITSPAVIIDTEGASNLGALISKLMQIPKKGLVPSFGITLVYEGQATVEKAEGYYAVTLPPIKLVFEDGRILDIGMISINARPDPIEDGRWVMALALPSPIVMTDDAGNLVQRIDSGQQTTRAVWDNALGRFSTYEGTYKNVKITKARGLYSVQIPELEAHYEPQTNMLILEYGESKLSLSLDIMLSGRE